MGSWAPLQIGRAGVERVSVMIGSVSGAVVDNGVSVALLSRDEKRTNMKEK